ncbi:hypothetical protein BDZ89DRAFT_1139828 [Hymenopellis radicata]|nr:hypothetical protein BDZ89DRAFT_1139828 [Hymenopellis radicata]
MLYKQKYVFPAFVIKGPNKPKVLDSFLFRGLHHLSAIQRENEGKGLLMWDGSKNQLCYSRTFFAFGTADAVGLPELDGRVGHHGARACRMGCPMKGRHKPGVGHYYAPHLRPHNFDVADCDHDDIEIRELNILTPEQYALDLAEVCTASTETAYKAARKRTGISKPSILSGLSEEQTFPIPCTFCPDAMHLAHLNLQDLLLSLWRGTIDCEPTDCKDLWDWMVFTGQTWKDHGQEVADATKYFPSSFHRPPRNPAEKISSGFKATEFYLYVFGLGPAHFRKFLPEKYWKNFCKLARAIRIAVKRRITGGSIQEAYTLMIQFIEEFEMLYYQRRADRIHFCRPFNLTLDYTDSNHRHMRTEETPLMETSALSFYRKQGDPNLYVQLKQVIPALFANNSPTKEHATSFGQRR